MRRLSPALLVSLILLASTPAWAAKKSAAAADESAPQLVSTGPQWKNVAELRQFADRGDPQACFELGDRLLNGDGLPADPAAARVWLEKAARGGVADAMFRLGKMNHDGLGGPQDFAAALDYYGQAARQGIPEAQHNIGAMLVSGRGVKRDYVEGLAWLIVAERNGAASDAVARTRAHLAKRPAEIAAAERRAAALLESLKKPAANPAVLAPRSNAADAAPAKAPPIAEPKRETPAKVKVDLGPGLSAPKPEIALPKG